MTFNLLRKLQIERMKKKAKVKKDFADTGSADNMIKEIRKKRDDHVKPESLPF